MRSSIKKENVVVESFEIKKLNQIQFHDFKQIEIRRIIDKSNEAFEQFYIENDDEMKKIHNALFFLIHFDKQIPKWKDKTTEAQSSRQEILIGCKKTDRQLIINNIWNNFKSFIDNIKPEQTENFKKSHQRFWKMKMFAKNIHQLQFDFYDSRALFFILSINDIIEKHNEKHNYSLNCEKNFFKYFNYEYRFTQNQRKKHENTNDFEKKKNLTASLNEWCVAMQEFCKKRHFFDKLILNNTNVHHESELTSVVKEFALNPNENVMIDSNSDGNIIEKIDVIFESDLKIDFDFGFVFKASSDSGPDFKPDSGFEVGFEFDSEGVDVEMINALKKLIFAKSQSYLNIKFSKNFNFWLKKNQACTYENQWHCVTDWSSKIFHLLKKWPINSLFNTKKNTKTCVESRC